MGGLSRKAKSEPFVPVSDRPMTEHPGVIRPRLRNKFSSEKRSKYIIGGY